MYQKYNSLLILASIVLAGCGGGGGNGSTANGTQNNVQPSNLTTKEEFTPIVVAGDPDISLTLASSRYPTTELTFGDQSLLVRSYDISYSADIDSNGKVSNYYPKVFSFATSNKFGNLDVSNSSPTFRWSTKSDIYCDIKVPAGWLEYGFNSEKYSNNDFVRVAGNDGLCDTSDDQYQSDLIIQFLDPSNANRISIFKSLQYAASINSSEIITGSPSNSSELTPNLYGDPYVPVLQTNDAALLTDRYNLYYIKPTTDPSKKRWNGYSVEIKEKSTNWEAIGYDESNMYIYQNSSSTGLGSWRVLKIERTTGTSTEIAHGIGSIELAVLGQNQILTSVMSGYYTRNAIININGDPPVLSSLSNSIYQIPMLGSAGKSLYFSIKPGFYGIEFFTEQNPLTAYSSVNNAYYAGDQILTPTNIRKAPAKAIYYIQTSGNDRSTGHAGGTLYSYNPETDETISYGKLPSEISKPSAMLIGLISSNNNYSKSLVVQEFDALTYKPIPTAFYKYTFTFGKSNSLVQVTNKTGLNYLSY